ncbi:MAG: GGDEF domain-containing protein [Pseudomonadota bacterium]
MIAIAAMGFWSFFLLDKAISEQRNVNALVDVVNAQQLHAQRLVLLTNLAHTEEAAIKRAVAINALRETRTAFEAGLTALKDGLARYDSDHGTVLADIIYKPPYDVNYFSGVLLSTTDRFLTPVLSADGGREAVPLSQMQLIAADSGLSALKNAINAYSQESLNETSKLLRAIFSALMILLALEALFIFSPLTRAIKHRTFQLKLARDNMAKLANHDELTGLHNRTAMAHQFPKIVQRHSAASTKFAVVHIDLDDFKIVNDTYGHAAGDAVLKETGHRLTHLLRQHDFTARIGGDEFVLILDGLSERAELGDLLDRLLQQITQPVRFDDIEIVISASAGVSVFPRHAQTDACLLVAADLALYNAKHADGSNYALFEERMRDEFKRNRSLKRPAKDSAAPKTALAASAAI